MTVAARRRLSFLFRNAHHIEQLLRDPQAIAAEGTASLVRSVNLIVESRCNIACACCHYQKTHPATGAERSRGLSSAALQLLQEVPEANVAVTGGEPLLSPISAGRAAAELLRLGRNTSIVTNGLTASDRTRGEFVRNALINALGANNRTQLCIRCSIDLAHQAGSGLPVERYTSACHDTIRWFARCGFRVLTRSIVTRPEEFDYFKRYVLPLLREHVTVEASLQPDMYELPLFAASFAGGKLNGVQAWLGRAYITRVLEHTGDSHRVVRKSLRTAPWALIEINDLGVKGPSPFVETGAHHSSVRSMLASYEWLPIAESVVPQLTITNNALPYRIDRRDHSVSITPAYLLDVLFEYRRSFARLAAHVAPHAR